MAQGGALSREELAQLIRGYFGQLTKGVPALVSRR